MRLLSIKLPTASFHGCLRLQDQQKSKVLYISSYTNGESWKKKRHGPHFVLSLQRRGSRVDLIYVRCFAPRIAKQRQPDQIEAVPEVLLPEHNKEQECLYSAYSNPLVNRGDTVQDSVLTHCKIDEVQTCSKSRSAWQSDRRRGTVTSRDQLIGLQVSNFFSRT
jgi:hypothetical protein